MNACDIISALLNQGRLKFFKVLQNKNDLQPVTYSFKSPHAHHDDFAEA